MDAIIQRAKQRGKADYGWLQARYCFSFAHWYAPDWQHWGPLRVLNHDRIAAGKGFPDHTHRDMEIVSYLLHGQITHKDSLRNEGTIRPGEAQRMGAGTGVVHSEWNDGDEETEMIQVWIFPDEPSRGKDPQYAQSQIPEGAREAGWHAVADGRQSHRLDLGTVPVRQDAAMFATLLEPGQERPFSLDEERVGFLYVAEGSVDSQWGLLEAGDSVRFAGPIEVPLTAVGASHLLAFDMCPMEDVPF